MFAACADGFMDMKRLATVFSSSPCFFSQNFKVVITTDPLSYFLKSTKMIRSLLLHIFLARRCFCQLKQCYHLDGVLSDDLPCDPSANVSACCGQNYTCSTNLYCTDYNGFRLVGSCTDKTWHDSACPLPLSQPIIASLNPVDFGL